MFFFHLNNPIIIHTHTHNKNVVPSSFMTLNNYSLLIAPYLTVFPGYFDIHIYNFKVTKCQRTYSEHESVQIIFTRQRQLRDMFEWSSSRVRFRASSVHSLNVPTTSFYEKHQLCDHNCAGNSPIFICFTVQLVSLNNM